MNSKILNLGQNVVNSATTKTISQASKRVTTFDDLATGAINAQTAIQLPNGKVVTNMLDAFIALTGTKVQGYNPEKIIDFIA